MLMRMGVGAGIVNAAGLWTIDVAVADFVRSLLVLSLLFLLLLSRVALLLQ